METSETTIKQCFLTSLVNCFTTVGRFAAIAVANIFINLGGESWRKVFWIGSIVAFLGAYARSSLKETTEFADAKRRLKKTIEDLKEKTRANHPLLKTKLNKKDAFYLFILKSGEALALFFIYSYCSKVFSSLGLSAGQAINYTTYVSIYASFLVFTLIIFIFYFNPLQIIKVFIYGAAICFIFVPILFQYCASPIIVFAAQIALETFMISDYPASPIIYKRFPVLQRFTSVLMISALSRAITWPLCAFGINYLTKEIGHYGLYIIFLPMSILSIMAVRHFIEATEKDQLENKESVESKTLQNV